jgi:hypothetical protein
MTVPLASRRRLLLASVCLLLGASFLLLLVVDRVDACCYDYTNGMGMCCNCCCCDDSSGSSCGCVSSTTHIAWRAAVAWRDSKAMGRRPCAPSALVSSPSQSAVASHSLTPPLVPLVLDCPLLCFLVVGRVGSGDVERMRCVVVSRDDDTENTLAAAWHVGRAADPSLFAPCAPAAGLLACSGPGTQYSDSTCTNYPCSDADYPGGGSRSCNLGACYTGSVSEADRRTQRKTTGWAESGRKFACA